MCFAQPPQTTASVFRSSQSIKANNKGCGGICRVQVPGGDSAEAGMAGAINGLGAKVGGLEALLALAQQRTADKADSTDVDSLR